MNKKITRVSLAAMNLLQQQTGAATCASLRTQWSGRWWSPRAGIRETDFVFKAATVPNGPKKSR
jgi:hypothetical protein